MRSQQAEQRHTAGPRCRLPWYRARNQNHIIGLGLIRALVALACLGSFTGASSAPLAERAYELSGESKDLESQGDMAGAARRLRDALTLVPNHPGFLIRLAVLEGSSGNIGGAQAALQRYLDTGLSLDATAAPGLAALLNQPQMHDLAVQLRKAPIDKGKPHVMERLGSEPIVAEGLAFDTVGGRMFVSTVATHSIYALGLHGDLAPLVTGDSGGFFGITVDVKARRLWASEASGPRIPQSSRVASTALVEVDLATQQVLHRYSIPEAHGDHQLDDVVVGSDHEVYVADAATGEIFRLRPGHTQLEVLVMPGHLRSAQGLVLTKDGTALIAADYATGLHKIDLATGDDRLLTTDAIATLVGIDGLVRCSGALIATQNGTTPERILRIEMDAPERSIRVVNVLAQGVSEAHGLALGVCAKSTFVYIGHSQWDGFDGQGARTPIPLSEPLVVKLIPRG